MSVAVTSSAFVVNGATPVSLAQMFNVTASASNPEYLVLTGLDRNEYTAGATDATGTLSGDGNTGSFSGIGSDARGIGIVFTYNAATGQYYNSTYGYLSQITYTASGSLNDITNLSLFGMDSLGSASAYAGDPYSMLESDPAGYIGSVTVATQPGFTGTVPAQATPDSIAATASSFVGRAWNMDGCWVLASTIAAEAGASLPVASTLIGTPGQANGEWIVAYNGPAGQSGNWQSMVTAGEVVVIGFSGGGGHITTCVSGSGSTAMLVDNITYINGSGQVANSANDGSATDVTVASPHPASQEWGGVAASSVVIYELDTPVVADLAASASLSAGKSGSLASWFSVTDPGTRQITEYQVYDTAPGDSFLVNGVAASAHTAGTAVTATCALSSILLAAGVSACTDTIDIRAFNGSYWGDWQSIGVTVSGTAPAPAPTPVQAPKLASQTPNQTWLQGASISFAVPMGTFTDPQGQPLAYAATLANGQALPGWLHFNAASDAFSGVVPAGIGTLSLMVTATDTSGLSAAETFQVTVPAAPPAVASQTGQQTVKEGQSFSLALPANTFTDPQGQALAYSAVLSSGAALPAWLKFNAASRTFSGTAPATVQALSVKVIATDTGGLSGSETFQLQVVPPPAPPVVANQTPAQTLATGQFFILPVPANTFTDPQKQQLSYSASLSNGQALPGWLGFSAQAGTFYGIAPTSAQALSVKVTATDSSGLSVAETFQVNVAVPLAPPVVNCPIAPQTLTEGRAFSFAVQPGTFMDRQGQAIHYAATLADGQALPGWISFNPSTETFSGTAAITQETLGIKVIATNASGLSSSETFTAAVVPPSPVLASQTPNQTWTDGQSLSFLMPRNTFTDPSGSALAYTAFETSGPCITQWLHFNGQTGLFSGLVPLNQSGTAGIEVVAANAGHMSASETFSVSFAAASAGSHSAYGGIQASGGAGSELLAFHT